MANAKLTPREMQIYEALGEHPMSSGLIAREARITTTSPSETAARYCIQLVKKGLAVKCGSRMFPSWKRAY